MSGMNTNNVSVRKASQLTGAEAAAFDTNLSGGQSPQLGSLSTGSLAAYAAPYVNFRNVLDGADFSVNPFQRGTSATGITNTVTYVADRWFHVAGGSSSVSVSRQAITAVAGLTQALQIGRAAANADLTTITTGQVLESADSARMQGQAMTLSFWAAAGANFSPTGNALNVSVYSSTGTDQSAANMVAGSWTGSTVLASSNVGAIAAVTALQSAVPAGVPASFAAGVPAQFGLTTTWTRYQMTVNVPANANQLGVSLAYTPTGTAGANDYFQIAGVQFEVGAEPSNFEHRDVALELELAQRYFWQQTEPAAGVIVGSGMNTGANAQTFYIALPMTMRTAPTVTVSAGTFKTNQAGTATATTITAGTTHTQNAISVNGNSAGTAGQATLLQGGGGTGFIRASAEY